MSPAKLLISRYLIVRNVPVLGCGDELLNLFSTYGKVEECKPMDDEECESFIDVYWIKFHQVNNARLKDGDDFDSSLDRGVPFTFKLGQCEVIEGWDEGITTMRKGENGTIVSQCDKGLEFSLTDGGFPVLKRISHSSPSRKVISTIPRCSGSSESSGDKSESSDQNKITRSSWV
ncbi:uncharacterized protein [Henckelia pumila]|uniref:uncharacterized protein isoform X2 n=1 Tax=Henckelia pumila TaxID=405737 RepID=UPI003C6E73C3